MSNWSRLFLPLVLLTGFGVVACNSNSSVQSATPEGAAVEQSYRLTMTVETAPGTDKVRAIVVQETIPIAETPAGETLLVMPLVASNVPTIATSVDEIQAHDDAGALTLYYRDQGSGLEAQREWFANRRTQGPLRFSYRAELGRALAPRGAAPPIDLRAEAGAFSGAGATFLLRPPEGRYDIQLTWDLSALGEAARGRSSLLGKNANGVTAIDLDSVYFMAGKIGVFPEQPDGSGFFSSWQGETPFNARDLMAWAKRLREHYQTFFSAEPTPYGIFLRRNKVNPGGGMGMYRSFVVTYDDKRGNDPDELKLTFAHEMFHTFQPRMRPEPGKSGLSVSWFNEGLAMFYQARLPFRFGMIDADAYLADINYIAGRYYTNILGSTPNSEVPAGFWKDTRIRTLPYDRGFLYFVTVDVAMRQASDGKASLDKLVLAMLARQSRQGEIDIHDWEQALRSNLGEGAVQNLHAMLGGKVPLPGSAAFGPCFERVSRTMRRYQLGFEPAVLTESPRIVRGLIPGSAAARAGVRNGDTIARPVGQDQIQGEQNGVLTLHLQRDGKNLVVSYKPRGETVSAWQWVPKAGASLGRCVMTR